jgi:2-polyprenyl-3-methyl-5-hydroxy-6-metoxy-1,4-benzoquinol methylase
MNCPSCDSNKLVKGELYREYTLYKCGDCGVQFWTPLRHPGKDFYETSELHRVEGQKGLQWRHRQFLESPPIRSGRLLDIACGTGEFLDAAKKMGFDAWGIDLSERQIRAAKEFYGLEHLFVADIGEFAGRKDVPKFDVITFFEVLEHLDDPHSFFKSLKKILSPDGFVVFSVPNTNRVGMGKEPEEVPPNHLFRWDRSSIGKFLALEDLSVEKIAEQPFSKHFFFTTGLFSFGLVKKMSKDGESGTRNSGGTPGKAGYLSRAIRAAANLKNKVLLPVASFLAFFPRILGFKYWDMYVVSKPDRKSK